MSETNEADKAEREPMPGEAEYVRARQMKRHTIPDFVQDGDYLRLLGQSAALGFPRAMSKLGDYAMRRGAREEAHYWLWRARQHGMHGLDAPISRIRKSWVRAGAPFEPNNRHELFDDRTAAAARALLDMTTSRNRAEARAFLEAHFPELLCSGGQN